MSFAHKDIGFLLAGLCVLVFLHLRKKLSFHRFHLFMYYGFLLTTALHPLWIWDVVDLI